MAVSGTTDGGQNVYTLSWGHIEHHFSLSQQHPDDINISVALVHSSTDDTLNLKTDDTLNLKTDDTLKFTGAATRGLREAILLAPDSVTWLVGNDDT